MNNAIRKPKLEQRTLVGLRIVLVYLLVGMTWIFFSDSLLNSLINDSERFAEISIYKGWVFVGATSLLILLLVRQAMASSDDSAKHLQARSRQLQTVVNLGQRALSSTDTEALVDEVMVMVSSEVNAELCDVQEVQPGQGNLLMRAGRGWPAGAAGDVPVSAGADTLAGNALETGVPIVFEDLNTETRFKPPAYLRAEGVVSGMSTRIQGHDRPYGVLGVYSRTARVFTPDDANFLRMAATVLGTAIARMQADEQLRSQLNFTNAISNSVADGLYVSGSDGCLSFMNPAAQRMLGWTEMELLGRNMHDVIHHRYEDGRPRPSSECPISKGLAAGATTEVSEDVYIRKDGKALPVSYAASPVVLDGEVRGVVVAFHDITERKQAQEALKESEQRFRAIFETTQDAIFIVNESGHLVDVNPSACAICELSKEEIVGMSMSELGVAVELPEIEERWQQLIAQGEAEGEESLTLPSGRVVTMEYTVKANFIPGFHLAVLRDSTERHLTEQRLRKGEQKYRLLIEQAADGIFSIDIDHGGRLIDANKRASEMLGYTHQELLTLRVVDIVEDVNDEESAGRVENLRSGQTLLSERTMVRKDGTRFTAEISSRLREDGTMQSIARDITERKRVEEEMRQSEQRFRAVFEGALDAIFITDEHGRCTDANATACALLGLDRDTLIGKPLSNYGLPIDNGSERTDSSADKTISHGEVVLLRADGEERDVAYRTRPRFFGTHTLTVAEDITARKAYERQLKEYGETQSGLLNQLINAQETERRRLSMEIHDGPLQSLAVGITDVDRVIRRHLRGETDLTETEMRNLRSTLVSAVGELRTVLADLTLDVLNKYGLEAALSSYAQRFPETANIEVTIENSLPFRLPYNIELIMYRLAQEALANVRKHSHATHAHIILRVEDGQLCMSIADDGRGFDPSTAEEQAQAGYKLGLPSMRQRIREAGGDLKIESSPGKGTKLEFQCPLPSGQRTTANPKETTTG